MNEEVEPQWFKKFRTNELVHMQVSMARQCVRGKIALKLAYTQIAITGALVVALIVKVFV